MTDTQRCKVRADWSKVGTAVYTLPKFVYRIPCTPDTDIVEQLGAIKERNDGRWNWWRSESKFHQSWHTNFGGINQGVARTQGEAEVRVLGGWNG